MSTAKPPTVNDVFQEAVSQGVIDYLTQYDALMPVIQDAISSGVTDVIGDIDLANMVYDLLTETKHDYYPGIKIFQDKFFQAVSDGIYRATKESQK